MPRWRVDRGGQGRASSARQLAPAVAAALALAAAAPAGAAWTPELVSIGDAPSAGAFDATAVSVSADATRIVFSTAEPLLPGDVDADADVYLRTGGVTTLLTDGPASPPGALLASALSGRVVFTTAEPLAGASLDNDPAVDAYLRDAGTTTLVSVNPPAGNATLDVSLRAISADGARIVFSTPEALVPASDADGQSDLYVWELGAVTPLTHVSAGDINGDGPFDAAFVALSEDGSRVLFQTAEPLVVGDTDALLDLYQWSGGVTTLVSGNGTPASAPDSPVVSRDGTKVLFRSQERLAALDTDSLPDVYLWDSGTISIVTAPVSGLDTGFGGPVAFSRDGTRAYVRTADQLLAEDTDEALDLYEWSGGVLRLLTPGPVTGASAPTFLAASDDGSHVLFATAEQLDPMDTDSRLDVYDRSGSTTTLVSAGGTGAVDVDRALVSADGIRAFLVTREQLLATDTDAGLDVYERSAGELRLVSVGGGAGDVDLVAVSADGVRAVLTTGVSLVPADAEARADVYLATLVPDSPPPPPPPAPPAPPVLPPPPAPAAPAGGGVVRAGAARLTGYRATLDASGTIRLGLTCVGRPRSRCDGTVRVTVRNRQLRQVVIGRATFGFAKPERPKLAIQLTQAGRRLVGAGEQRSVVVVVSTRVPGAKPSAFSATVTVVVPRVQAGRPPPGGREARSPRIA